MSKVFEGDLSGNGLKVAVVVSRFNEFFSKQILSGALDSLKRYGVDETDVDMAWTPGAYEIPLIARRFAQKNQYDAIICLGVVIRGATPHFDHLCAAVTKGIADLGQEFGLPVTFGVVTADNLEQAIERSGGKSGNKGREAAVAAIEMANLIKDLDKG